MKIIALNRRDFSRSTPIVTGGLLLGFEAPVTAKVQISAYQLGLFLQMPDEEKFGWEFQL